MKKGKILCYVMISSIVLSASGCKSLEKEGLTAYDDSVLNEISDNYVMGKDAVEVGEAAKGELSKGEAEKGELSKGEAADEAFIAEDAFGASAEFDADRKITAATEDIAESKTEIGIPETGQLTAGEWNDNDNWGFFSNLVNAGTISFPSFGIDPRYRTMVTVKSEDGSPIVNAKARLFNKNGDVLWSAVTDKQGRAFLFAQGDGEAVSVEIENGGEKERFDLKLSKSSAQNKVETENNDLEVMLKGKSKFYKHTDIMFIVDSTASMSDEMLFLQSEFTAITKAIGTENTRYSVNFYRDEGDEYVTKCNDFTSDADDLQKTLNNESADGGGDYPEAVADILKETIFESNWEDESVKLAFLIFDAPPHDNTEEALISTVKEASEKGVRIIPVVSSDSDRDAELFARSLAITTGGDYVFLTDDSGIGNSHLEPIIGSYEVRKLYDIIIDIINDYKQ